MFALDSETTGLDLYHGSSPFLVTICDEGQDPIYWEWPVNPLTREVLADPSDLEEIQRWVHRGDRIATQNGKFDAAALRVLIPDLEWPWDDMDDCGVGGHLLRSDHAEGHLNLNSMCLYYLGQDMTEYERELEHVVKECRRLVATKDFKEKYGVWRIAKEGLPEMPSAKETTWRFDYWLPKAVARVLRLPKDHLWHNILVDYACADSAATYHLWIEIERRIKKEGLWAHYREAIRCVPVIAQMMEYEGLPVRRSQMQKVQLEFKGISDQCLSECVELADGEIEKLPVNGRSKALDAVVFGKFGLKTDRKTDTGNMSMDKHVLDEWMATLNSDSCEFKFIKNLRSYRKRQTALGYLASYEKYGIPCGFDDFLLLHPWININGTVTLRMSSHGPNEQQISKQEEANLRDVFGPLPGEEWWALDAQNIELRIPAYESGEPDLIALFERPKDPPYYGSQHLLNFHTVYPDIWDEALKLVGELKVGPYCKETYADTWYQWVKNGGFAIQYQAGKITADQAFRRKGSHALLKERFSRLENLNQKYVQMANQLGYVETTPDKSLGMKRGYPIHCPRGDRGGVLSTLPLNYHVQSTAMWWMRKAMVRVSEYIKEHCPKGTRIVAQVHDELLLAFPKGWGMKPWLTNIPHIRAIQKIMASEGDAIDVITPVSVKYHDTSWRHGLAV